MDPLTQGTLGATFSQSKAPNQHQWWAMLLGWLAGMTPDLDYAIQSSSDPLLHLEFHRQFTHSLIFIPVGALLCSGLFYFFVKRKLRFKQTYLYCFLGYASHGLLDACTTYGTQLFWPFTNYRVAWNSVSIIDPLFSGPLFLLVVLAVYKKRKRLAQLALLYAICYQMLGHYQHMRAERRAHKLAQSRGHSPKTVLVKPTFGNLILWKTIYEQGDMYYTDAVKLLFSDKVIEGESLPKLKLERDFSWLNPNSQQAKDVARFRHFSQGYIAMDPNRENTIVDMRYSLVPGKFRPLWGIVLFPHQKDRHVAFKNYSKTTDRGRKEFLKMLFH